MRLTAKVIRISHAEFHCNRLTTVGLQDIQDYASLIFWDTVYYYTVVYYQWTDSSDLMPNDCEDT